MKRKVVVCKGCAFLMVLKGVPPFCLADAYFVDSELCKRVDVKNVKVTGKVNAAKNCKKKKRFDLKSIAIRRWLKADAKRQGYTYLGRSLREHKRVNIKGNKDERRTERAGSTTSNAPSN
jgi:hypothetical protein